ncbi:ATP-binding cassette domain-containing protein [Polaromonas sp. P2-4]|nr:ATP-binding cassette domain-containing protein [Polaromonas sp. P2-4]
MAAVELRQVVKSYDGKNTVIHGIDLDIRQGEFCVFVGPSGCGKSTLLRMIAGLETISGGEVRIGGQVVNDKPPRSRDIAMVFQDYALYPHKTLYDNMAFGLQLRKTPEDEIKRRVMDAARLLRIDHMLDRRPAALSGGQRQRSPSAGPSCASPRCSCSTSRCPTSMPSCAMRCAPKSSACTSAWAPR